MALAAVAALAFDVFGTVTDWRSTIIDEGREWSARTGRAVDWSTFADAWRSSYEPAMHQVRRGELPWTKIDDLHRMILDRLLEEYGLVDLDKAERSHMNRVWHRLQTWPDSGSGLERRKRRFRPPRRSTGSLARDQFPEQRSRLTRRTQPLPFVERYGKIPA